MGDAFNFTICVVALIVVLILCLCIVKKSIKDINISFGWIKGFELSCSFFENQSTKNQ